uniref:RING-type domain-containing protein n=1 Tax=Chenopodium quinoa TaxID=63459 RepID=A0A803M7M3_CHEQI
MGHKMSKDELVYQRVIEGNIDAIKALCTEGAGLEWIDKQGKTPLIVACMDPRLYIVAKTLIELGANVNAYRPAVVSIYFVEEDQELNVFFEVATALLPFSYLSRESWVVVVPCSLPNTGELIRLEFAVYSSVQDAQPRTVIPLWKSNIVEPKFRKSDPSLIIFNKSTGSRFRFLSSIKGDKQQLIQLHSACKGFLKVRPSPQLSSAGTAQPEANTSNQPVNSTTVISAAILSAPSAPPLPMHGAVDGPIHRAAINMDPVDLSVTSSIANGKTAAPRCVICWEAPVEGACVPCGHMAGCMSCLSEIKSKKGLCPVCQTKIDKVLRLYAV